MVELRDGRIALADLKQKLFALADLGSGNVTPVGQQADTIRPGDPGRYKLPGYVVLLSGDTLGLVDFATERTTLWDDQGHYAGVLGPVSVGGHNLAVAVDARGDAYKEDVRSVLGGLEPGSNLKLDSLNVLRIPRGDSVADTVARLKLPEWGRGQFGEQVKIVSTIFSGRDVFGVLPDGTMWIARASNNAVDWLDPDGKWLRGRARPFTRVPVKKEEKDAFLDRIRQQMARMGAPAGVELSYPFATEKPPFSMGLTNPAGQAWLQRSREYSDSVPVWDVVGRDGREIRTVQLPRGASLAGFGGDGRVYVLLRHSDGSETIARYTVR